MAQLRNTTVDDTGNLSLPSGTTAQRPATLLQGMIRYNTTLNDTEYYDGTAWRSIADTGVEATGGTIIDTEIGGVAYRIHTFTTTGNSTFTVSKGGEVEYLIVAGGGGGGGWGGGGGAGGLLTGFTTVTPQSYTIAVGVGGARGTSAYTVGGNGGNSSALGVTATGGGGGGRYNSIDGSSGGSGGGGGGGESNTTDFVSNGGGATAGQGNIGGRGRARPSNIYWGSGGGGGAGSAGRDADNSGRGGDGGNGLVSFITGNLTFYAGGGGGHTPGEVLATVFTQGGVGGGGAGGRYYSSVRGGDDGTPNTGGGGGGAWGGSGQLCGLGGSGIVIIRYRRNASTTISPTRTVVSTLPNNLNIVQNNLVWYVDAANPVSYSGTGSTWQNIRSSEFNGTLRNSPTFSQQNGGYFVLGSNRDVITGTTPPSLQGNPNLTVSGWFRRTVSDWGGARGTWGIGGNVTNEGINSWWNNNNNQLSIDVWSSGTFVASGIDYPFGQWVFMTWQKIAGAMTRANCILWRNLDSYTGTQLTISRAETGNPAINNVGITLANISPTHTQLPANSMEIGEFFVYNRVLTAQEVTHNFNVTRGRYGI